MVTKEKVLLGLQNVHEVLQNGLQLLRWQQLGGSMVRGGLHAELQSLR